MRRLNKGCEGVGVGVEGGCRGRGQGGGQGGGQRGGMSELKERGGVGWGALGRAGGGAHSLTSLRSFSICGCDMSLSMTMPRTSFESSRLPPTLPSILIRSRLTSFLSMSATDSTASTWGEGGRVRVGAGG